MNLLEFTPYYFNNYEKNWKYILWQQGGGKLNSMGSCTVFKFSYEVRRILPS